MRMSESSMPNGWGSPYRQKRYFIDRLKLKKSDGVQTLLGPILMILTDGDFKKNLKMYLTPHWNVFSILKKQYLVVFLLAPKRTVNYTFGNISGVMHIWHELRKARSYRGPKRAGLAVKNIMDSEYKDMMESCVVCGPGFVKFKLSRKWIAQGIHKMLTAGIDIWAPKLSVKKTVIYFLSQTRGEEMHMGHLRSTFIGETLARLLEYSGVVVIHKRINDEDPLNINLPDINHLDMKLKKMKEYLIERFSNGEVNNQAIGELEVNTFTLKLKSHVELYNKSKKFDEDAGFRERAILLQLGLGPKSPNGMESNLHALVEEKADWVLHVSDEGKRDSIEKCIIDARRAKLIVTDPSKCPLSHVGFGLAQGDDFKHLEVINFVNVPDEAKSRCKMLLARQGIYTN
ncbi:anticodon-binding aminoacyl-tRNA synthetase, class 1a [Tanacetum coccineum]